MSVDVPMTAREMNEARRVAVMTAPTTISGNMMLALAEMHSGPADLDGPERWINALTLRALTRRKLVRVEGRAVHITATGVLVVNAYLLGAKDARSTR